MRFSRMLFSIAANIHSCLKSYWIILNKYFLTASKSVWYECVYWNRINRWTERISRKTKTKKTKQIVPLILWNLIIKGVQIRNDSRILLDFSEIDGIVDKFNNLYDLYIIYKIYFRDNKWIYVIELKWALTSENSLQVQWQLTTYMALCQIDDGNFKRVK